MYTLGIDLGTTFTAAATWRDGHAEVVPLGSRAAVIPTVVLLREDETVLTGDAANRRGLSEPQRLAREFKRRFGDTTPILLGGVPYSAESLMAKLLRAVIDDVTAREGGPPRRICVSHPANWGPYKRELLDQVSRLAGIDVPVTFAIEPVAAAVFYAHQQRVESGSVVAVYDLGGGTFDATVLRKSPQGFEILGQPEGIERLGGIDFDAAVFHHVGQSLAGKLEELDEDDPNAMAAVARLKEECVAAKEALSSDTDTSISVLLPNVSTEIRLTRAELEGMLRPTLHGTVEALRRALDSASVTAEQLHSVLLVGGSSRIPLVTQLLGAELGRPVAVDAHPKYAIVLGAAWLSGGAAPDTEAASNSGPGAKRRDAPRAAAVPAAGAVFPSPAGAASPVSEPATAASASEGANLAGAAGTLLAPAPGSDTGHNAAGNGHAVAMRAGEPPQPPAGPDPVPRRRWPWLAAAVAALVLLGTGAGAWAINQTGGFGDGGAGAAPPVEQADGSAAEQCTDEIMANERWVCLASAVMDGGELVIDYEAEWAGDTPDVDTGHHLHIWGADGREPPDSIMGSHAGEDSGNWVLKDASPAVLTAEEVADVIGSHSQVCARIADASHALVPDADGGYETGTCVPIKGEPGGSGEEAPEGPEQPGTTPRPETDPTGEAPEPEAPSEPGATNERPSDGDGEGNQHSDQEGVDPGDDQGDVDPGDDQGGVDPADDQGWYDPDDGEGWYEPDVW